MSQRDKDNSAQQFTKNIKTHSLVQDSGSLALKFA